jgi:hypothetical protein
MMKNRYIAILFIMVLAVAVCVAGCTGGNAGPTANPTTTPGGSTTGPTSKPQSSGPDIKLYNDGNFNWVEYNLKTSKYADEWDKMRYDYTDEDYQGTPVKHMRTTMEFMGIEVISDVYYSKATGKAVAAKTTTLGVETNVDQANLSTYDAMDIRSSMGDITDNDDQYGSYVYKGSSPDVVVTSNGKTYTCTKYTWWKSYSDDGSSRVEVWIDSNVPAVVKMVTYYKNEADTQMELLGWG